MLDNGRSDFLDALVAGLADEHPEADAQDITRIVGESCSAIRLGLEAEDARGIPRWRRGSGGEGT